MTDERELERHINIVEQIKNAKTKDELPNVNYSKIASYLATNVYFNKQKISQTEFKPVIDEITNYGYFKHPDVRKEFIKVVLKNYPGISEEEVMDKYSIISNSKRIEYLLQEISLRNEKLNEILKKENLDIHEKNMKDIRVAFDVKDLPKVGIGDLNRKILRAVNDNDFNNSYKTDDIRSLTSAYLNDSDSSRVESIVDEICSKEDIDEESKSLMREQIISSLIMDETILYTVEEIKAKENRKLFIYKNDHEITMEGIKEARRISQLPPNLTISSLTGYLQGNTTIYSNDNRIKNEDLKQLSDLLLDGHKWEDDEVKDEIKDIVERVYPDKEDAYQLLFNKLSTLPRTYYLVEEINYSLERQKEFIGNRCSNVNVYFIPNDKSPIEGGRFYNCYINRVKNLDLTELLPLNLDEIVPPSMDIDSVEWFVREKTGDDTFKTAGGIILNKDETIGNVNVFRPNDGKIGVSPEEKEKMDKIDDLDKKIAEKEEALKSMDDQLNERKKQSSDVEDKMKKLIHDYEVKALSLQKELLNSITELKKGLSNEETQVEEILDYNDDKEKDEDKTRGVK